MIIFLLDDISVVTAKGLNLVYEDDLNIEATGTKNENTDDIDTKTSDNDVETSSDINTEINDNNDSTKNNSENDNSENDNSEIIDSETLVMQSQYEDMDIDADMTLDGDMTVNNLTVDNNSKLNLNGHVLTVYGEVQLKSGSIEFNNGILSCEQNVKIEKTASLKMPNINDCLIVKGNLNAYSLYTDSGSVIVSGDFIIESDFKAGEKNKFVFNGEGKQIISINTNSYFNIIELKNFSEEGVYINYAFSYKELIDNNCILTYNDLNGERGFTLEEDTEIDGMFYLVIDKLDLNGHTLTINGDFIHGGGDVILNGGSLIINGDYITAKIVKDDTNEESDAEIESEVTYTYETSSGKLTMNNSDDYIYIAGSYVNKLGNSLNVSLTSGVMEIKGDMDVRCFQASDNHTLYLSGDKKQTINTNAYATEAVYLMYDYNSSYINNLTLDNISDEGIVLSQDLLVAGEIKQNNTRVDGRIAVFSKSSFAENQYTGDLYIVNYNAPQGFTVYGDVYIYSMTLNNKMNIHGNTTVRSLTLYDDINIYGNVCEGSVSLGGGNVYISGNSDNVSYSNYAKTEGIISVDGNVSLSGGNLSNSTIETKGDLSATKQINIKKLILSGVKKQSITNSYNFIIATLELNNYSEEGIHSDNLIMADEIISNGITISCDSFDTVGDWTLEKDEIYDGDLILTDGEINLNGHKLTVTGDLIQQSGTIFINHGELDIQGSYRTQIIANPDKTSFVTGKAALIMNNSDDKLVIDKNLVWDTSIDNSSTMYSGCIEIKGDISVYNKTVFPYIRNGKLILNGTGKQKIDLKSNLIVNDLEIDNASEEGITISPTFYSAYFGVRNNYNDHDSKVNGEIAVYTSTVFADDIFSPSMFIADEVTLSDNLTILGNMRLRYDSGRLILNNVCLNIKGNYNENDSLGLIMTHESDRLNIEGNFSYFDSFNVHSYEQCKLTNGVISVKGKCTLSSYYRSEENHKLLLNGDKAQEMVIYDKPYVSILEIDNQSDNGVTASAYFEKGELITNGYKFRYKGMDGVAGWKLNKDEEYDGDLNLIDGKLDLNGHTLTVHGDFSFSSGKLYINGGKLIVEGDFRLQDISGKDNSGNYKKSIGHIQMDNPDDEIVVYGDMYLYNDINENKITEGVITLYSDLYVYYVGKGGDYASDNAVICFSGDKEQTIYGSYDGSPVYLNNIRCDKTDDAGISTKCKLYISGEIKADKKVFNDIIYLKEGFSFKNGEYFGDVCIDERIGFTDDIRVHGNIVFDSYNTNDNSINIYCDEDVEIKYSLKNCNIILCGSKKQNLKVRDSLDILTIDNSSDEGVYCDSYFSANAVYDISGNFHYPYKTGYKLEKDEVIEGDFYLGYGTMDLNGYKLTVKGDLIQDGGDIDLNGGTLHVKGNYSCSSLTGRLIMDDEKDYILVEGDMCIQFLGYNKRNVFDKGIIEIKGNLDAYEAYDYGEIPKIIESTKIMLTGDEKQRINCNMKIGNLTLDNSASVELPNKIDILKSFETNGTKVTKGSVNIPDISMLKEENYNCDIYLSGDAVLKNALNVNGTLYINDSIDLNGYEITADNIVINGKAKINRGRISCKDSFTVGYNGELIMKNDSDYLYVGRSLNFNSNKSHSDNLTAGTIELFGDFIQNNYDNFTATGTHKTIISKRSITSDIGYIHTLKFSNNQGNSIFNVLVLKEKSDMYDMSRDENMMAKEIIRDGVEEEPPAAPRGIKCTQSTVNSITLEIEADNKEDVLCYEIYRDGNRIATISKNVYTDKNLVYNTEYAYEIYAYDKNMKRSESAATLSVKTADDTETPTIPSDVSLISLSGSRLSISWLPSTDNYKVKGYNVYRNDDLISIVTSCGYEDTGLEAEEDYDYKICAFDDAGNESSYTESLSVTTVKPVIKDIKPENYKKLDKNKENIYLYYKNYGYNENYDIDIEYYDENQSTWISIADNTYDVQSYNLETDYISITWDTSSVVQNECKVRYSIADVDGNRVSRTLTYYIDNVGPAKVENLNVLSDNETMVLNWDASRAVDCAGYKIYRRDNKNCEIEDVSYTCIYTCNDKFNTKYKDLGVETGFFYEYKVLAYDFDNNYGDYSDSVMAKANNDNSAPVMKSAAPEAGRVNKTITIVATAEDNKSLKSVIFEIKEENTDDWIYLNEITINTPLKNTGVVKFNLNTQNYPDGVYYLRMTAVDAVGNRSEEEYTRRYEIDNTGISKINIESASAGCNYIQLKWDDVDETDFGYFAIEQFRNGSYERIAVSYDTLGCNVKDLTPNTYYRFRVVGYDNLGNRGIESDIKGISTTYDDIPPIITSVMPVSSYYNDNINLTVTAKDNYKIGGAVISYSLDRENYERLAVVYANPIFDEPDMSYNLDIKDFREGDLYIKYEVYDQNGNKNALLEDGNDVIVKYIIDRTAPEKVKNLSSVSEGGYIELNWDEAKEDDISCYKLYRADIADGFFTCVNANIKSRSYYDTDVVPGNSYMYKLVACDIAGNDSEESDTVIATVAMDTTRPCITGVSPVNNSTVGKNSLISVMVIDNSNMDSVDFEYLTEDNIWVKYDSKKVDSRGGVVDSKLKFDNLPEKTYSIRIRAIDSAGNYSEYYYVDYKLDNAAPDISVSAETGDYNIVLNISSADYEYMEIYRRIYESEDEFEKIAHIEESEYTDTGIEPHINYEYMVRVYDGYGNYKDSETSVCYADDNDVIAPVAVIPEYAKVQAGFEILLDGGESYDNIGIVSYVWDMGNGDILTGPYPRYIYDTEGIYDIKLTVTDASGNTNTSICKTEVISTDGTGTVEITVMDSKGAVIPYALLYMNDSEDEANCYKTDANGRVTISAKAGEYKAAAYKQGYLPKDIDVVVNEYTDLSYNIIINKGDIVVGEIKTHRMTLQEMVDAGVDFSNPANYHNFVFTITLEFAERPIPIEYEYIGTGGSFSDGGEGGGIGVKYKGGQPGGGAPDEPKISIKPVEVKTEAGPVEIPLITYIKTTQSVSWLKDMYMVELGVLNMADSGYTIKDSYASLNMPKGISLAAIKKGQSQSQYMGDIKGQEKKFTSWVVKVDDPGEYKVTADFSGTLMPFEAPVNAHFDSEAYISSGGYDGLEITVMPESTAYTGELYYIQFKIENNSGRPLYNFSTSFGPYTEPGVKYESYILDPDTGKKELYESYDTGSRSYPEMSEYHYTPVLKGGERMNIRTLDDGQVIYGTYVTGFPGTADPTECYYELVNHMVEVIDGENLGVSVYVKPISGHVSKQIFCFIPRESIFGDPVDMTTGAYVDDYEALSLTGVAELSLDLSYNSRFGEAAGELGYGWTHNFESYISDDCGMIHLYTSPDCCASYIDEESYNGNIYGHMEDGVLIPAEADDSKDMVYRCITTGMEDSVITRKADGTYILDMPSGDVFTYDENGKISGIMMSDKSKADIIHTDNQTIVTEEGSGNRLILDYSDGRLISVSDDEGRKTTFAYTDGYLTTITNPMGETLNYEYDDKGRIIKAKNNYEKVFVENTYDEEGRVIRQLDFEGNEITMSYTDKENGGMLVTATDTEKAVTTYETDAACRIIKTTNPDGSSISHTYDVKGNLVSVFDEQGNAVSYTYDEKNRNTGISSSTGLNIAYTYNEKDEISALSDGSETTYMSYDESGNIINVRKTDKQVSYTYDDKGRLTSMTRDGKGTEKFNYNDDRFLVSTITNELGNSVKLDYDQRGNIIRRTTPEGEVTGYEYDLMDRLTAISYANGSTRRITYDIYGNPTSITDGRGNTISYEYNTAGKLIKICYPDGTSEGYVYNAKGELVSLTGVDGRKISYMYDIAGNLTKIDYPDGTSESYEYGTQGLPTAITGRDGKSRTLSYMPDGKLGSMKLSGDSAYEINYDGNNHISSLTDEDGNTVSYIYDNYGNLSKVTDELGYVTNYEYNCWDELLGVTDANGNRISYEYDAAGCVTAMIYPDGTRMDISYDKNGRLLKVSTGVTEGETRTVGISYTYDEMGNIKTYTDEMGTVTSYEYDLDGNLTKVLDDEGKVCAEYEYDCMDRLISEKTRDGSKATYKYDICGNVIQASVTTASGEVKTYAYNYDEDSVLTDVEDPAGIKTSQSRDKLGYITDITYPEGGGISYTYDDMHRLTKETLSIGTEYSYEYNADNLLSKFTNGRGQETTYEYDKLGRITSAADELGTISYTYDGCGNVLTVSETDKGGNTQTIRRTYDCMNRVSSYTDYKGNTVKYGYDELGNLISLTYAGGEIVRYKYYDNGALKEVIDTENLVTSYTYDKRGALLTTQNPDGTTEVNTYDDLGQLATRTLYKAAAGEENYTKENELYSYTYTYDDWGNITGISYSDNLPDEEKTSDGLFSDAQNETDLLKSSTMTYDSSNRMITYNGEKIEYDSDGNMTHGPLNGEMVDFEYDCRNRLIRAGDTEYTYDAENIRTAAITPKYTEEYITDSVSALSRVLEIDRTYQGGYIQDNEDNAGKSTEHEIYYYGNGLVYEKTYADNEEEKTLIYHYDHLGSTKLVTDIDGETVCRFDYGTYGEPLTTEYDKTIRFLYNGQLGVVTDDNGLYYMRSRYYNPEIKRFINQDILTGNIGNSASLNRYSYVEGNPISYTDPFGLSPFSYFTDKIKPNISVHTALDALGCIPGPVGTFFDLTNAGLYFAEGDWKSGTESIIFAIPGMDLGGKGTKFIMKGTKAGKIVGNILKGVDFVGNVAAAFITADRFGNNVAGMIDKYMVNEAAASWDTVGEVGDLLVSGLMVGHYSKGAANSASSIDFSTKEFNPKDYAGKVVDESLIENVTYGGNKAPIGAKTLDVNNIISVSGRNLPLKYDLQFFAEGGSRTRWGKEHGRGNVKHNNAIETELDKAYIDGASDIRKNRVQRDANGKRVYSSDGKYTRPDASYVLNGKRYNTNYISNYTLDNVDELNRELEAFQRMVEADSDAINRLVFQY